MKGAKDEDKLKFSPLFPRLHVNDAEKGGPRAPPRNKMALYEHLTVPFQRITSESPPILPLPTMNRSRFSQPDHVSKSLLDFDKGKLPENTSARLHKGSVAQSDNTVSAASTLVEPAATVRKANCYVNKDDDISDTSVADFVPGVNKIPENVVTLMGEKEFFRARRVIANQQKAFSMQVFELHRLIKVQKLIAGSPEVLVERSLHSEKPFSRSYKSKIYSSKKSRDESRLENLPPALPDLKPWCYHPSPLGNQWLIPIMSPSEGLVYKPLPGPFTPGPPSFMVQDYGNQLCPPGFGLLPGSYPSGHLNFLPYMFPLTNTSTSSSAVHKMNSTTDPSPNRYTNLTIPDKGSSNVPSQRNDVISRHDDTGPTVKDNELQISSPSKRARLDVLPLFPLESQQDHNHSSDPQTKAIKVVPHNPRSATESAARIFRYIQEERNLPE